MNTGKEDWFAYFPGNYRWSAGLLIALSTAPWGASEVGEIDRIGRQLRDRDGDDEAWFRAWVAMAETLEKRAGEAAARRQSVTAAGLYRRACMYYQTGERFRQPKDQAALEAYRSGVDCMKKAAAYLDFPSLEYVEIPYEQGKSLPAIFMKGSADRKIPQPVVVFFDGLDVTKEMCSFFGVADLVRRGVNCLLVDGPGNGESVRCRDLQVRYDQEVPAGAAVDYLLTRADVHPDKIGVMALSLGGYYAPRAAAFEKRFKACAAWGAQWDYREVWKRRLEAAFKADLSVPPDHICWFTGTRTIEEALVFLEKFTLAGVAERIECPFLLVHGLHDTQIPMEDARTCFNAVGSKDKTLKVFSEGEGGLLHCNWDYLTPVVQYMYDWLAEKLNP